MSNHRGLALVGYRACGKTYLARRLGEHWRCPAIDADDALEAQAGKRIPTIFADAGEEAFRQLEHQVLTSLLAEDGPRIVATGGGCVIRAENRQLLRDCGRLVVYQQASVTLIKERLGQDSGQRPALRGASLVDEVAEILAERLPWYEAVADLTIDAEQPLSERITAIETALASG